MLKYYRRFDERDAKFYISKVADAVEYLHNMKVYHRDIKLDNIFISADDDIVKLGDFGIALNGNEKNFSGKLPYKKGKVGTTGYRPPDNEWSVNGYSPAPLDVFALGIVLFQLLTGLRVSPFFSEKEGEPELYYYI